MGSQRSHLFSETDGDQFYSFVDNGKELDRLEILREAHFARYSSCSLSLFMKFMPLTRIFNATPARDGNRQGWMCVMTLSLAVTGAFSCKGVLQGPGWQRWQWIR